MSFLNCRSFFAIARANSLPIRSNRKRIFQAISRAASLLFAFCLVVTGCGHRRVAVPPPPAPPEVQQPAPLPPSGESAEEPSTRSRRILSTEVGIASWYGAPYHNARGANGQIYNQNAMTAAHRTLPLGTVVRVTNLATHQSAIVTITDRGPFIPGRTLDLSRAAALKTGVWRTGIARVRIDVLSKPSSATADGRWCVQIGVLRQDRTAKKLHEQLQRQYPAANVIDFKGATGYWVRIRPERGSHSAAIEIARELQPAEGEAYLVRLD